MELVNKNVLSIIIPAFNAGGFIKRCLDSVYDNAPDLELFEVIVINDGSKDNTELLVKSYCETNRNLILINKENEGVSVARNIGIQVAHGDYVLFLDSDDELIYSSLKKVIDYLSSRRPIDMLVTRQVRYDGIKEYSVSGPPLLEFENYDGVNAYQRGYIRTNAGGGIVRRQFLLENALLFPYGVKNAEDTIFFGHLQVYAQNIVYYNLLLYRIIEEKGSASRCYDSTELGLRHIVTIRAVEDVKMSLRGSRKQNAVFDSICYQLLSNTVAFFVKSNDLSFKQFNKVIRRNNLLPLDVHNMYLYRNKAILMNYSFPLFYFLSWLKHNICLSHINFFRK